VLLLDTHVLIWTVQGEKQIGRRTRALISKAESQDAVRVSPATLFEVSALHTAGRLRFDRALDEWISDAFADGRIRIVEVTPSVAIAAGRIPREALPDPLDRVLVETARRADATFVTADARILGYAAKAAVRVHDAGR
jgi:PIN domain nuclease of toxin-antitoxin system